MIDRTRRIQYAEQLRHFAAGVLTVDEYEKRTDGLVWGSDDPALHRLWRTTWRCYDDFRTEKMRGQWALNAEARHRFALMILFLHSGRPFAWPAFRPAPKDRLAGAAVGLVELLLSLLDFFTRGAFSLQDRWYRTNYAFRKRQWEKRQRFMESVGDYPFWPFLRRADYEEACRHPRFCRVSQNNFIKR